MPRPDIPRIIRLLVVSESPETDALIDRLCESFGEERYLVHRAAKALDTTAIGDVFDAVLLDLKPLLAAGKTKAEGVVATLAARGPVIALTTTLDEAAEQSLRRAGATECLFAEETSARALRRTIRYAIATGGEGQKRHLPRLFDPSTGLASQFLFWEILGLAARRAKRNRDFFALLLLEVADLPLESGDTIGDAVMQVAAERVSHTLRASDTVARFERHQLAILVESMPRVEDIQIVAEKIVQELAKPFPLGDLERHFPVSLGISLYPTSADTADMLIGKAFEALAGAKARGKDQFVFA
ncbi:MAG TPA: diguanylate cyclase [Candidatus Cybelea sp.]|nr:diguanylate cyclase [Candidatus Cybelea sp.]